MENKDTHPENKAVIQNLTSRLAYYGSIALAYFFSHIFVTVDALHTWQNKNKLF